MRAMELLERGVTVVRNIRGYYQTLVDEGLDQRDAEVLALDGSMTNNYDTLAVIWAAGMVGDAYDAVHEDVEGYIFEPFCE